MESGGGGSEEDIRSQKSEGEEDGSESKPVILFVRSDPEPHDEIALAQAKRTVTVSYAHDTYSVSPLIRLFPSAHLLPRRLYGLSRSLPRLDSSNASER
jgi:hypothetical protein